MGWRTLHDVLKWIGISFFPALVAIFMGGLGTAAAFPESKPWLAARFQETLAAMSTGAFWFIALTVLAAWSFVVVVAGNKAAKLEKKPDLADLADILKQLIPPPIPSPSPLILPLTVIRTIPDRTKGGGALEDATLEAAGKLFPVGLFVAEVVVSAARLAAERCLEIAIKAFNGTGAPLTLVDTIEGRIRGAKGTLSGALPLPPPIPLPGVTSYPVDAGSEFLVAIRQPVPKEAAAEYLKQLETDQITLDLRALNIRMAVADDPDNRSRLPLWDAVTLRRRDDIATGRLTIMPADATTVAVTAQPSLSLTVTRADGTKEEGNA